MISMAMFASILFCPNLIWISCDNLKLKLKSQSMKRLIFGILCFTTFNLYARIGLIVAPDSSWATIIINNKISGWGGEGLCEGAEALTLFDSLKIRPELGTDSVMRSFKNADVKITCENVRQFNFVTCNFTVYASEHVIIDPSKKSISARWDGDKALALSKIWDSSCGGDSFLSENGQLSMIWDSKSVVWNFGLPLKK